MNAPVDTPVLPQRRPRNLAQGLVENISERIRGGDIRPGDKLPTESEIMRQFGVSRTVVREALSRLQASGLVETHHGVGTYALEPSGGGDFRVDPADIATVRDVLVLLELRICLESEAAGLAAVRRSEAQLAEMRRALDAFKAALDSGGDTITPDFQFHLLVSQATDNRYFADLMSHLGSAIIPAPASIRPSSRTRTVPPTCRASTWSTKTSTAPSCARMPKAPAPRCAPT